MEFNNTHSEKTKHEANISSEAIHSIVIRLKNWKFTANQGTSTMYSVHMSSWTSKTSDHANYIKSVCSKLYIITNNNNNN